MRREMQITGATDQTIQDGQHRHGTGVEATVEISDDMPKLVAKHISVCPKLPRIDKDSQIPLKFIMNEDITDQATIICGFCKNPIGVCSVKNLDTSK